jgi:hypothetical protein
MIVIMQEKVTIINYLIISFSRGTKSFMAFIVILVMIVFGMSICQMTLYGNSSLKYSTVFNAFIFTIYSPVFLSSGQNVGN